LQPKRLTVDLGSIAKRISSQSAPKRAPLIFHPSKKRAKPAKFEIRGPKKYSERSNFGDLKILAGQFANDEAFRRGTKPAE
jgi:hypothetical protein